MKRVYLDHNATAPLRPEVRAHWLAALDELGGNPSSVHASGRHARHVLDEARERTAAALAVREDEIVFTSGGTESNNLALAGHLRAIARASGAKAAGLATTAIEHSSVLATARALERDGHPLEIVPVDPGGIPDLDRLDAAARRPEVRLVSVMAANNELGHRLPLERIGERLAGRDRSRVKFHTDAVQALGRLPLELDLWGIDLATFSAHKLGGPVGVGVLVRRAGVALEPLLFGGEQESGLRPGTEDVAAIAAASVAIELAVSERASFARRAHEMACALWRELHAAVPRARLLGPALDEGDGALRLPGTLNVLLPDVDGKVLVTRLDLLGLELSAGSACASGSLEPSHVLLALGLDEQDARSGLRISIGRTSTWTDVRQAVDTLRTTCASADARLTPSKSS